jgi:hypothetical protein
VVEDKGSLFFKTIVMMTFVRLIDAPPLFKKKPHHNMLFYTYQSGGQPEVRALLFLVVYRKTSTF